ncbi:uncharacterized protein (TIGR02453 family) [Thermonema lapsum]|uniref:Uncharacterized protein (TIGR02453 family) n=1 Tax=Thermonema lapsum TaxID=28195 RepID=A0A846MRF4_9BACT|nr:DUF2461 domain-containing protein [Thermonema lapsum]NIK74011.1 uncharacterized protein (TIGR02453 family) [Thermonema lapsum]
MQYTIYPETLVFLQELKQHNNREWMIAHREAYEQAKQNFSEFVEAFIQASIHLHHQENLTAAQCIFRLARDTRFNKDKTPYKTNFGALIAPGGRKSPFAGFYLHIEPGASFVAAGLYAPSAAMQKAVRQEIYYEQDKWLALLQQTTFVRYFPEVEGELLQRLPKEFADAPEALQLSLRRKRWIVRKACSDEEVLSAAFPNLLLTYATVAQPLIGFLNTALEDMKES